MTSSSGIFEGYGDYYDLLYKDKDYAGEAKYVVDLLQKHSLAGNELLELGAGTGKHAQLMAQDGYQVSGIELSASMVAKAVDAKGVHIRQGDIRDIRLGRKFDAVLSLFHVLSYQLSNDDVTAVFATASEHLDPGGLFLADFWYSPAVHAQAPEVRVKRVADSRMEVTRIAEPVNLPNENRVDVSYTIFARDLAAGSIATLVETHPMRHFSLPELDIFAAQSGFERIAAEEFFSGKSLGRDTWSVCTVNRKR